jgi:3-phosphoshikimate 1-carboxyvinyltransferase
MILTVKPSQQLKGSIQLPGSKSYSIRAFIIAACGGKSVLVHPSDCDDAMVALAVAKSLGASVVKSKNGYRVNAQARQPNLKKINVKESGTVLRFILPLAGLYGRPAKISGEGTLHGRPNKFLTQTLRKMGLDIRGSGAQESIPITIKSGQLRGGSVTINGGLSSQFISALLIAAPRLREDTRLSISGPIVSADYITMTRAILNKAKVRVHTKGPRLFLIPGRQTFKGLGQFRIPSDLGLAAFPLAAGAITDSRINLKGNLSEDLIQADGYILAFLKSMGARFSKSKNGIKLNGPFQLRGGTFSLKSCPDLVPIMAVLALFAKGTTRLTDIAHARAKESNRISDLRHELLKVGADIKEKRGELIIYPKNTYKNNVLLDPHKDHRLAMAFAVLGVKVGVRIKDMECVSKSYPAFIKDMNALGVSTRR